MAILGISGENSNKTQAIIRNISDTRKKITALVDSGSSISLISWFNLQTLDFKGTKEEYKGKTLIANNAPMLVKGKLN